MNTNQVRHLAALAATLSTTHAPAIAEEEISPANRPGVASKAQLGENPDEAGGPRPEARLSELRLQTTKKRQRRELLARPETLETVLELLCDGQSFRTIAANRELFPMGIWPSHLLRWLTEDPARLEQYTRAREAAADLLAEEIIAIADDVTTDPQCRRVRIDVRKWYAGKLRPKVYGDRVQQDVTATLTLEDHLLRLGRTG